MKNDIVPLLPSEYKGNLKKQCGYTTTIPREWTDKEIEWIKELSIEGYSLSQIAQSCDRSETSIAVKLKRISKKEDKYNLKHLQEKYDINLKFLDMIKPKNVLDVYCGVKHFYKSNCNNIKIIENDLDKKIECENHKEAFKFMCELYSKGSKFDLIDLDPFGSAYDSFDLAIKMANKGICITLGELGHKRWKRLDFVRPHYDINKIEDFTIDKIIEYIQKIGLRNKKKLIVCFKKEWQNIGRVWFKIEKNKVVEQWEKENKRWEDEEIKEKKELNEKGITTIFDFMEGEEE